MAAGGQGTGGEQTRQSQVGPVGLQVQIGLDQIQANQRGHFAVVQ